MFLISCLQKGGMEPHSHLTLGFQASELVCLKARTYSKVEDT